MPLETDTYKEFSDLLGALRKKKQAVSRLEDALGNEKGQLLTSAVHVSSWTSCGSLWRPTARPLFPAHKCHFKQPLFLPKYQVAKDGDCSNLVTQAVDLKNGCERVIAEGQEAVEAAKAARKAELELLAFGGLKATMINDCARLQTRQ